MNSGTINSLTASQKLRQTAARAAELLRAAPDPDAPVPGLTWTVSQAAAHMLAEFTDYAAFARGERDPGPPLAPGAETPAHRNAAANEGQLARFTERDLPRLADMVVPAAEDFLAAAAQLAPGVSIPVSNGMSMTVPTMTSALLGELLIHGLDIARAAKTNWAISRRDALGVIAGIMALVPGYVDRRRAAGLHVTYELRFRGGPRYQIAVDDGTALVTAPDGRPDCWISADPAAFLLVGYGRSGQWAQIARGKLLAGGRKPWLGLSFARLITGP